MSLISLSGIPECPCYILQLQRLTIMLDCPLDQSTTLNFLPLNLTPSMDLSGDVWKGATVKSMEGEPIQLTSVRSVGGSILLDEPHQYRVPHFDLVNMESVDVVLISNSRMMMALPFLTERTGFQGAVYATEPTIRFGMHMMTTLIKHNDRVCRRPSKNGWKYEAVANALDNNGSDAMHWTDLYTLKEVTACMLKCVPISYNEKRTQLGSCTITAHSSGYCIGAANWVIATSEHKISYMSASTEGGDWHPLPLELNALAGADACVVTGLSRVTRSPMEMENEFKSHLVSSLVAGGSVLVPMHSSGIVFDMLETIISTLAKASLRTTPVYFVSPSAKASLEYANICAEWLCAKRSDQVFSANYPFHHKEFITQEGTGILQLYPAVTPEFMANYHEPCVVIADQPSLRSGDAAHFIQMWNNHSKNTCIIVEPDFDIDHLLAPFQPLLMKVAYCPIDPALNFNDANKILQSLAPKTVVIPPSYLKRHAGITYTEGNVVVAGVGVAIDLIKANFERAFISEELAKTLSPSWVDGNISAIGIQATVDRRDYLYMLEPTKDQTRTKMLMGSILPSRIVQALSQHGFRDVTVFRRQDADVIRLEDCDAEIVLSGNKTEIVTHNNETLRHALRDSVLSLLTEV